MSGRAPLALALLVLAGCGGDGAQRLNERRSVVPRRPDALFAERPPAPDAEAVARSRRIDRIERLVEEDRLGEARTELDAFFAEGGDHPQAQLLMGRLLAGEGRHEAALPWFERAVAGSPRWPEPRLRLAQAYIELERFAAAESVYQEFDRLLPEAAWGPWGMGAMAWRRGDTARALDLLAEALRRDPRHAPSLRTRAQLAAVANDAAVEREMLDRYLAEEPHDAEAHLRLGDLADAAGLTATARRRWQDAWDIAGSREAARRLAALAGREGDAAAAQRWRERAGEATPDGAPAAR